MTREYSHNGLAGCVSQRRAQETSRVVGVYRNDQAGLDDEYPWSTVCEDHGHIVSHPSLELARAHAAGPLGWCEACMDEHPGRT